jgi:poly-gamma-glutamate synthesis protein (capsule biosynthesis protein)
MYKEKQFLALRDLLQGVDVAFTNLEMIFHTFTEGYPAAESGGTYTAADPALLDDLQWLGFNLYAAANNHSMDWSEGGLLSTMAALERQGMAYTGIGRNLAEARAPVYLETAQGRVAMLSMTSTFPAWSRAGEQRLDTKGRPGVNPLRFETQYILPAKLLKTLQEISQAVGLEAMKAQRRATGFAVPEDNAVFHFLNQQFVEGKAAGFRTMPHQSDMEGNLRWIADARRQADWVFVSLHAHEARLDKEEPADFIQTFAYACIDAGADAFLGHGPHLLRGIELYKNKPIFYSLGNFIFQNETVRRLPADIYETYKLSMDATPAAVYDARTLDSKGKPKGFPADTRYWESVVAVCRFEERGVGQIELYPVTLGFGNARPRRGRPQMAEGTLARKIIKRLADLSAPFHTHIEFQKGMGRVKIS